MVRKAGRWLGRLEVVRKAGSGSEGWQVVMGRLAGGYGKAGRWLGKLKGVYRD